MHPENENITAPAEALAEAFARWKKTVEAELKGADFDKKLVTRSLEGVSLQPLYTRATLAGIAQPDVSPGAAPFLRGVRPLGYRDRGWEIAQEIAARSPAEFNSALLEDLMLGQNCVSLGSGRGPAILGLQDLAIALAGVDFSAIPVHLRAGADAGPLAALFLTFAQQRGFGWERLSGSITADPIAQWAANGQLPTGLPALYDSLAGWTTWSAKHAPRLQTIGVDASLWGHAGATAVQELGFALATATEYLRELAARKTPLETVTTRIRFSFAVGPQFFTEVAKFRAIRPLWTRVVSAFGAPAEQAGLATVHAMTGRWNKTLLDPHVNMLRVTTEALSAVLGGCDSLHIAPFDEVTGSTSGFSRRIARNVHTLLAEEFSFAQVADPAGGSWYVEKLTDELARKAWELFQSIEGIGGMSAALRAGRPQQLVAEAVGQKADAVNKRRLGLIGTNLFPNLKEKPLSSVNGSANGNGAGSANTAVAAAATALPATAAWPARFEAAMAAAAAGANLATLAASAATGEAPIKPVAPWRASAGFEYLRAAADAHAQRTGARPRVFLAKMGPVVQHKPRADFSAGFFAVGGFEVLAKQAFDTADAAATAAVKSGAPVAVLCSTDETYPDLVPAFTRAAKAANPTLIVILAGLPADPNVAASFRAAGVDEFIHVRADVHQSLATLLKQIGASA